MLAIKMRFSKPCSWDWCLEVVIGLGFLPFALAQPCETEVKSGLFISLATYFFVTVAAGVGAAFYVLSKTYWSPAMARSEHATAAGMDEPDDLFDKMAESWQIMYRDLKFDKRIGVGNVGEVYKGKYRGRDVAIKKLLGTWYKDDDMIERFKEEILLMSTMNHQNVLMFVGAVLDRDAGNICLVTELCHRGTLYDLLQSEEPLSWPKRLKMARDIALGMDYLHNKAGIIQRDLKSQNLLVTKDYDVKVADFGLSRQLAPGKMQTYCGTPATMAPEIVLQQDYNEKADVFSFGIILWELLTREEPYPGCSGLSLAYAVATEGLRPPVPAYCPAEWAGLMMQCWASDPRKRPSFDELQRALAFITRSFDTILQATIKPAVTIPPTPGESQEVSTAHSRAGSIERKTSDRGGAAGTGGKPAPWVNAKDVVIVGRGHVTDSPPRRRPMHPFHAPSQVRQNTNTAFQLLQSSRLNAATALRTSVRDSPSHTPDDLNLGPTFALDGGGGSQIINVTLEHLEPLEGNATNEGTRSVSTTEPISPDKVKVEVTLG